MACRRDGPKTKTLHCLQCSVGPAPDLHPARALAHCLKVRWEIKTAQTKSCMAQKLQVHEKVPVVNLYNNKKQAIELVFVNQTISVLDIDSDVLFIVPQLVDPFDKLQESQHV